MSQTRLLFRWLVLSPFSKVGCLVFDLWHPSCALSWQYVTISQSLSLSLSLSPFRNLQSFATFRVATMHIPGFFLTYYCTTYTGLLFRRKGGENVSDLYKQESQTMKGKGREGGRDIATKCTPIHLSEQTSIGSIGGMCDFAEKSIQ